MFFSNAQTKLSSLNVWIWDGDSDIPMTSRACSNSLHPEMVVIGVKMLSPEACVLLIIEILIHFAFLVYQMHRMDR